MAGAIEGSKDEKAAPPQVITVINTKKASIQDLSEKEIEAQLTAIGLPEFISTYVDYFRIQNNLSSILSTQYWILSQPGIAVEVAPGTDITLPATVPEAENGKLLAAGTAVKIQSISNLPPGRKLSTLTDEVRWFGLEWVLWKFREFNQMEVVKFETPSADWFLARNNLHASIGARLIILGALYPTVRAPKGGFSEIVEEDAGKGERDSYDEKKSGLTGDQIKNLASIGLVRQNYMSALTILMCFNQYDRFLRGESLVPLPVDNVANIYMARLTRGAYLNRLHALLEGLRITPSGPVESLATLKITEKERKLLDNKIASDRARREAIASNTCEHLTVAREVGAGKAPASQLMAFCGDVIDHKVMCNVCGMVLMCEHVRNHNLGKDIKQFEVETDKITYCSSCGEQLSANFLDVPISQVEFDKDVINIIMYQYSIMKRHLVMPITLNERMLSRALNAGIYEDVNASINLINSMRGISELERIDRIYLQTYIYVWVYILYLIALYKLDIKILDKSKGGGSQGDKIVRIIQGDMRNILSKNPTINVTTLFQKAMKNYFSGTKPGEDMMKKESGALIQIRILNDPFINQNQLGAPVESGRTKLFDYAVAAVKTKLTVTETEGTSSMALVWPPMPPEYIKLDGEIKVRQFKARINPLWRLTSPRSIEMAFKKNFNLPFVNLGEKKRKIKTIVYLVDGKKVEAPQMPAGATIGDLLDADGRSMYELLPDPYEFKPTKKSQSIVEKKTKTDFVVVPQLKLDEKFDDKVPAPLKYLGASRGVEYAKVLNGSAPQVYNLCRLTIIVGYLSSYTAPEKANTRVGEFIGAVLLRDGVWPSDQMEKLCVTGINLVAGGSPKTIEKIVEIESRLAKPEITSASLLRAYLSRNAVEDEEPMDADALIEEKEISDDAYANVDYDGQNDESAAD